MGLRNRLKGLRPRIKPRQAQRLHGYHRGDLWLVPAGTAICLVARLDRSTSPVLTCAPKGVAHSRGVAIVTLAAHPRPGKRPARLVIGVAPDPTGAVVIHDAHARTLVPVRDEGLFFLRDRSLGPPMVLSLR